MGNVVSSRIRLEKLKNSFVLLGYYSVICLTNSCVQHFPAASLFIVTLELACEKMRQSDMNSSVWKCVQYIMNATRQVHEKGVLEGAWVNNELVGGFWKFQWCQQLGWCVRLWERRPLGDYSNRNQWFLYKHHQCFLFRKSSIQRQKQTSYMEVTISIIHCILGEHQKKLLKQY